MLTHEHFDALEICDEEPTSLADAGSDPVWWQLLHDLRAAGLVSFDDGGDEAVSTDAGHRYLEAGWAAAAAQAEYEETPEDDDEDDVVNGVVMTSDHVEALDGCCSERLAVPEASEDEVWWRLVNDLRTAGFVEFDDDDAEIVGTDAGREWLDAWGARQGE